MTDYYLLKENEELRKEANQYKKAMDSLLQEREVLISYMDKMTKKAEEKVDILSITDGREWAEEFCRLNPSADKDYMIAWFCNAIEVGREAGKKNLNKKLNDRIEQEFIPKKHGRDIADWSYYLGYNNAIGKVLGVINEFNHE